MKRNELTENVRLYRVPSSTALSALGIYGDGFVDEDGGESVLVSTPELRRVVALKISAKTFIAAPGSRRIPLDDYYRTPAEAWAAWRNAVEQKIADVEQELKYLRQDLHHGLAAEAEGAAA